LERPSAAAIAQNWPGSQGTGISVARIGYRGWPDCFLLRNGSVEAVVVPAIGRVMQLRLAGEAAGAFWENRALDGQTHSSVPKQGDPAEWINFGGDKSWPAPQTTWRQQQGRDWPPPAAFDSRPMEAFSCEQGVVLISQVDPGFGIQVVRHVELDRERPVMRIRTEYRKLFGEAVKVGVWTITQMQEPELIGLLLPTHSAFANGYIQLREAQPEKLKIEGRLLSFVRHPGEPAKIGTDSCTLAWVGRHCAVRICAENGPGEYPDGGCVTQVYTNPDPLNYVELETLGPLATMKAGDRIERSTVYTVLPRSTPDAEAEARKIL